MGAGAPRDDTGIGTPDGAPVVGAEVGMYASEAEGVIRDGGAPSALRNAGVAPSRNGAYCDWERVIDALPSPLVGLAASIESRYGERGGMASGDGPCAGDVPDVGEAFAAAGIPVADDPPVDSGARATGDRSAIDGARAMYDAPPTGGALGKGVACATGDTPSSGCGARELGGATCITCGALATGGGPVDNEGDMAGGIGTAGAIPTELASVAWLDMLVGDHVDGACAGADGGAPRPGIGTAIGIGMARAPVEGAGGGPAASAAADEAVGAGTGAGAAVAGTGVWCVICAAACAARSSSSTAR